MARQDWFNPSTSLWSDWNHLGSNVNPANVQQQWYRDPSWGGHITYNPDVGFQDYKAVEKFYGGASAPVTQEQLLAKFSPQLSDAGNWQQYFPDRPVVSAAEKLANQNKQTTQSTAQASNPVYDLLMSYFGGGGATAGADQGKGVGNYTEPSYDSTTMLKRFGYTGGLSLNPYEQAAMDLSGQLYQDQGPLKTLQSPANFFQNVMLGNKPSNEALTDLAKGKDASGQAWQQMLAGGDPAGRYYGDVLAGKYAPQGQAFQSDVYNATREGAIKELEEEQKRAAQTFAQRGGYFGGKHSTYQSNLADKTLTGLNQTLANLNLSGYQADQANRLAAGQGLSSNVLSAGQGLSGSQLAGAQADLGTRLGAAENLTGIAPLQMNITNSIMDSLLKSGGTLTQKEAANLADYQGAQERAYQDWLRGRQESMLPFQYAMNLLGFQPNTPVVQQPQESPWNSLFGTLGGVGAKLLLGGI
jgi:hypothetical protein